MTADVRPSPRRRVRRLALAHAVSVSGSQAAQVAVVYVVYSATRSGAWVIAALAASISVNGLLGPASGWVADHLDRRQTMTLSEVGAGLVYLGMVFTRQPVFLVLGALGAAVVGSPFRSASAAAVPNLVADRDLAWANGQLGAAFNLALVAGPLLGGALVAASGPGAVFATNAVSYLVSAVLIRTTTGRFGGRGDRRSTEGQSTLRAATEGFRALASDGQLGLLAAASALAFGAFGTALVIDPALAVRFHAGAVGYGLLTSTWGAGAVLGSLLAGRMVTPGTAPRAITVGMAAMAISLGAIPVLPTFGLIVGAGTIGGVGSGLTFVPWLVIVQERIADALRGRVIAASESLNQMLFLVGMGVAAPALTLVGPHHAYGLTGIILAIGALCSSAALWKTRASATKLLGSEIPTAMSCHSPRRIEGPVRSS